MDLIEAVREATVAVTVLYKDFY